MIDRRTAGRPINALIEIHEICKYKDESDQFKTVEYKNIESWDIVNGHEAEEIEAHTDGSCIDDYHEYLVLHFGDGEEATFRNSYVDMFRVGFFKA